MKIARVESLHADAGQRNFDFLKITTDDGLVGWSEYNESFGGLGVSAVIDGLAPQIVGKDPRAWESLVTLMYAVRRQAAGGIAQQAIGAIENALLDLKARALGVPVYELLGGPVRDRIRLYWSHCGTYRLQWSKEMQIPALRTLDDVKKAGRDVVERGFTALKTNVFVLGREPYLHSPGFARRGPGYPELNAERYVLKAVREEMAAFREGAGPDVDRRAS
jgi:galactonate dehydratase